MNKIQITLALLFGTTWHDAAAGPLPPALELSSFKLADDALALALVAAEPDVVSPVAIAWDEDGRLFVAEMIDYPVGPKAGRIRLLEDRDGDGRYERATVFADRLAFPNSVLPWNGGVLVTAAPDLLFLKDTDGDGRADERRVLFTGFGEGNQQLRANGLTWGLDNWIYGANGRSDGEVHRSGDTNATPVSLRGHDFGFNPRTLDFQPLAGRSQFGVARDDWGNRFLSWNTIPIRHEVFPERYVERNPLLPVTSVLHDLLPPGDTGQVFPISPVPQTFNSESTSHFNALAGLAIFRGDALGESYRGNAFVGESLRNLIHRRVLEADGVTFSAKRGEQGREFLASTDPWFHPVNFATGPDGALYIVDFYRQWVEHPGFVHSKAREEIDWRTGSEHGRIWKVVQASHRPRAPDESHPPAGGAKNRRDVRPALSRANAAELVALLEDQNAWWRDTAQRLLIERQDRAAVPLLSKLASNAPRPVTRLQALFALDELNGLENPTLSKALHDDHPRVREGALRLAEPRLRSTPELARTALGLISDSDARVRLQLALVLGEFPGDQRLPVLITMSHIAETNRWLGTAVLTSLGSNGIDLLRARLVEDSTRWRPDRSAEGVLFLERVAELTGAAHREGDHEQFIRLLTRGGIAQEPYAQFALLASYADGLRHAPRGPSKSSSADALLAVPPLQEIFRSAVATATNAWEPTDTRTLAVRVLGHGPPEVGGRALLQLFVTSERGGLQSSALRAFSAVADAALAGELFESWSLLSPGNRRGILAASAASPAMLSALLSAMEHGAVSPFEVDAATRDALQKAARGEVRPRLEKVLQPLSPADRAEVLARYRPSLRLAGQREGGAAIFSRNCLQCHAIEGRGQQVGPDLSGVASRPAETLLADVLDPSGAVPADFVAYEVLKRDGEIVSGLVVSESPSGVTVRRANQPDETVLRSEIRELRASGKSLMPDGLEAGMSLQDMADLLAFLRQPGAALLPANP